MLLKVSKTLQNLYNINSAFWKYFVGTSSWNLKSSHILQRRSKGLVSSQNSIRPIIETQWKKKVAQILIKLPEIEKMVGRVGNKIFSK